MHFVVAYCLLTHQLQDSHQVLFCQQICRMVPGQSHIQSHFPTNISAECWADGDEGYLCHPHGLDRGVLVDGDGEEGTEEVYECKVVHDVPQVLNILLSLYLLEDFSNYWIPIISDNSLHIVNTMFDSNLMQDITNNQNIKLRHETNRKFL